MDKLQFSSQIINFWLLKSENGLLTIGSDIFKTSTIKASDFEQFLLSMDEIGTFYNDYTEKDDTYSYKEFMKETESHKINELIDTYMKDIIPQDAQHFDLLHQDQKFMWMHDSPMPTSDTYQDLEAHQRREVIANYPFTVQEIEL